MTILRKLITYAGQTPAAAATVPSVTNLQVILADGTYISGTQLQNILGTGLSSTTAVAPNPPTLTATAITANTITLHMAFSPTGAVATTGSIQGFDSNNNFVASPYVSARYPDTIIDSLQPSTTYTFTGYASLTAADTSRATSGVSANLVVTTSAPDANTVYKSAAPTMTFGTPTPTSIPYTIIPATTGSPATTYNINYFGNNVTTSGGGSALTGTLTYNITPNTTYTINVAGSNSAGYGDTSINYQIATPAAAAQQSVATAYTVKNKDGQSWPTTTQFGSGYDFNDINGHSIILRISDGGDPASVTFALGSSATTPPVSGQGDYGVADKDNVAGDHITALYYPAGDWTATSTGIRITRHGQTVGTVQTKYIWVFFPDGTAPVCMTTSDGSAPFAITVTY
jgi:hypothetical protein